VAVAEGRKKSKYGAVKKRWQWQVAKKSGRRQGKRTL